MNASKPEWFQLVDSDAPSAQVNRVDKKLPVIAAVIAGAIIASGTFFASASHESQAISQGVLVTNSTPSDAASIATNVTESAASKSAQSENAGSIVLAPTSGGQGGIQAPTGGDDDEDYEDHDDDDSHDRDHHEDRDRD